MIAEHFCVCMCDDWDHQPDLGKNIIAYIICKCNNKTSCIDMSARGEGSVGNILAILTWGAGFESSESMDKVDMITCAWWYGGWWSGSLANQSSGFSKRLFLKNWGGEWLPISAANLHFHVHQCTHVCTHPYRIHNENYWKVCPCAPHLLALLFLQCFPYISSLIR